MNKIETKKWSKIIYFFWIYTLIVILWGAWVRISHSGDGCGDHWPLCEGQLIPTATQGKTWIEFTHRIMSGSYGLIVLYIYFQIKKLEIPAYLKKINYIFLLLMITEALLGAALVKGKLVTIDDSFLRLIMMSLHQLNSFMLTGVTFLFYYLLKEAAPKTFKINKKMALTFLLLPVTGAIAALSSTLFPSISVLQGILDDFSQDSHLFIRLRVLHPIFAILIAGSLTIWLFVKNKIRLALEFLIAITIGLLTLITLSPAYLKLTHLLIAHYLWAKLLQMLVSLPDSKSR